MGFFKPIATKERDEKWGSHIIDTVNKGRHKGVPKRRQMFLKIEVNGENAPPHRARVENGI